jgi:3-phosphoshikimate 1-carboxyvinyltransferase
MNLLLKKCASVRGEIRVGGDKSMTHRALIVGAVAEGKTFLHGYSKCADCMATLNVLKKLGIIIEETESTVTIHGRGLNGLTEPEDVLDCENSGTTMRLFAGLLSGQDFYSVLTGDSSLRKRPMDRVTQPLHMMGANIIARSNGRFAPLSIKGGKLKSIEYKLPVASAQVKSAILLAGLYADGYTIIEEPNITRDHTERILNLFGVEIERKSNKIILKKSKRLQAKEIIIPGDISSAAYLIALATIIPETEIQLNNVGMNPTRIGILDALKTMGADISVLNFKTLSNEPVADLVVKHKMLKGMEISGKLVPRLIDEIPIIAVVATQAEGITVVKDAQELRVKETDRIKTIVIELKKMGAKIDEKEDGFIVEGPTRLRGATCNTFGDHRIAMTLTIAGLVADGITKIDDVHCIGISFPEFIQRIKEVCGAISIFVEN